MGFSVFVEAPCLIVLLRRIVPFLGVLSSPPATMLSNSTILYRINIDFGFCAVFLESVLLVVVSDSMAVRTENLALRHLFSNSFFRISVIHEEGD